MPPGSVPEVTRDTSRPVLPEAVETTLPHSKDTNIGENTRFDARLKELDKQDFKHLMTIELKTNKKIKGVGVVMDGKSMARYYGRVIAVTAEGSSHTFVMHLPLNAFNGNGNIPNQHLLEMYVETMISLSDATQKNADMVARYIREKSHSPRKDLDMAEDEGEVLTITPVLSVPKLQAIVDRTTGATKELERELHPLTQLTDGVKQWYKNSVVPKLGLDDSPGLNPKSRLVELQAGPIGGLTVEFVTFSDRKGERWLKVTSLRGVNYFPANGNEQDMMFLMGLSVLTHLIEGAEAGKNNFKAPHWRRWRGTEQFEVVVSELDKMGSGEMPREMRDVTPQPKQLALVEDTRTAPGVGEKRVKRLLYDVYGYTANGSLYELVRYDDISGIWLKVTTDEGIVYVPANPTDPKRALDFNQLMVLAEQVVEIVEENPDHPPDWRKWSGNETAQQAWEQLNVLRATFVGRQGSSTPSQSVKPAPAKQEEASFIPHFPPGNKIETVNNRGGVPMIGVTNGVSFRVVHFLDAKPENLWLEVTTTQGLVYVPANSSPPTHPLNRVIDNIFGNQDPIWLQKKLDFVDRRIAILLAGVVADMAKANMRIPSDWKGNEQHLDVHDKLEGLLKKRRHTSREDTTHDDAMNEPLSPTPFPSRPVKQTNALG